MEFFYNVIHPIRPGEWLASLELKDVYFHVPIGMPNWEFLRFALDGVKYRFKVLPFGLSTSPRIFTKVLAPVMAAIRLRRIHIHPYLDDILLRAPSQILLEHLSIVLELLMKADYVINMEKSQ